MSLTINAESCEVSVYGRQVQIEITGEDSAQVLENFDAGEIVRNAGKDALLDEIGEKYAREYFGIED